MMKAIAGCSTDNVLGVKGVGEKTAIEYLRGKLVKGKRYDDIGSKEGWKIFVANISLVKLPMQGTNYFKLEKDELSEQGWKQVVKILGMSSIRDRMPFGRKRK